MRIIDKMSNLTPVTITEGILGDSEVGKTTALKRNKDRNADLSYIISTSSKDMVLVNESVDVKDPLSGKPVYFQRPNENIEVVNAIDIDCVGQAQLSKYIKNVPNLARSETLVCFADPTNPKTIRNAFSEWLKPLNSGVPIAYKAVSLNITKINVKENNQIDLGAILADDYATLDASGVTSTLKNIKDLHKEADVYLILCDQEPDVKKPPVTYIVNVKDGMYNGVQKINDLGGLNTVVVDSLIEKYQKYKNGFYVEIPDEKNPSVITKKPLEDIVNEIRKYAWWLYAEIKRQCQTRDIGCWY